VGFNYFCDFSTVWVIGLVAGIIIVFDVCMAKRGKGDTISDVILGNSLRYPVIPFLFGVLMGHLFWPQVVR
jgi:hypothetical protein